MELKCHKIRGVEKETCSAEQVIAYNYARMYVDIGQRIESNDTPEFIKGNMFADIKLWIMQNLDSDVSYSRYNFDAIIIAFQQGFRNFCAKPFIATNYADIGKAFPIPYPVK